MKFPYFAYLAFVILLVIDPLFVAVGLLWFGQGVGLLPGPHNAVHIDARRGRRRHWYRPCLVRIAVAAPGLVSAVAGVGQPSGQGAPAAFQSTANKKTVRARKSAGRQRLHSAA